MAAPIIRGLFLMFSLVATANAGSVTEKDIPTYRKKVEQMFHHAYDSYIRYAYPYDELRPLTCDGLDTWGSYSLTLIDAMGMLVIMGNNSEFQRVSSLVIEKMNFDQDINVSVFETNIRIVGGLVSAHLLSKRGGLDLEPGWPCSGPLLRLAEDVARRLLPAFDTPTGMPYGTVNLKHGVPVGETTVTCTAGVGTMLVEFTALSRLTGDPIFEKVAMRAMRKLWELRSPIGLVGNHIDVASGKWTALDAGIGGGVDSYFEYLVKGSVLLQSSELLQQYREYMSAIEKYLKKDDWYMWAHMTKGSISLPLFTSLDCYLPGMQAMLGDIDKAMKTIHNFHQVWKQFGFLPEYYNIVKNEAHVGREGYPLRPELIESAMYLYRATKDPYLLEIGADMIESIEANTRTKCGYATVKNVNTHTLENRMESFFLAETTKYLYLLFDPDNFIHNTGDHGTIVNTPNGECVVDAGGYIFNTEAHPIDMAALYCCSAEKQEDDQELQHFHDNLDLLTLFGLSDKDPAVQGVQWTKKKKPKIDNFETYISSPEIFKKAAHQVILSTQGQKFTVKPEKSRPTEEQQKSSSSVPEPAVDDLSGSSLDNTDTAEDTKNIDDARNDKESSISLTYSHCDKDGCKDVKHEIETETQSHDIPNNVDKTESEENNRNENYNEDLYNEKYSDLSSQKQPIAQSETQVPQTQFFSKSDKISDVFQLLKSFTSDILSSRNVRSVKSIHEKLKYYELFQVENQPKMLVCQAQPFYMRYSLMGEMFLSPDE